MGYKLGWKFCFAGALLPFVVGLTAYATGFIRSILLSSASNWTFIVQSFDFTFADLLSQNSDLAAVFFGHVQATWTNVHNSGMLGLCITYFGLRTGQRWAWFPLLYRFAWAGINDSIALCIFIISLESSCQCQ